MTIIFQTSRARLFFGSFFRIIVIPLNLKEWSVIYSRKNYMNFAKKKRVERVVKKIYIDFLK